MFADTSSDEDEAGVKDSQNARAAVNQTED